MPPLITDVSLEKSSKNQEANYFSKPSYSPDLNPIEHGWHKVKTAIRKELAKYEFNLHKAVAAAFQYL
ncbi:transposase [Microseira sp. BLCC-F43]|jgi:transposase|uniref:transposase n=1 Tax=Microseira sp. BLCC-F43 TaxID=3153602 RepID=UPI0035BA27C4